MGGKRKEPDFNHRSWDATIWSLWGWIYTGAESDNELKNAILREWRRAKTAFDKLGPQTGALAAKVDEWREVVEGLCDTIPYAIADSALVELRDIAPEIEQQLETDRALIAAKKKPAATPKQEPKPKVAVAAKQDASLSVSDEDFAAFYTNSVAGHSKATAKSPPKKVTSKTAWKPPTAEETWVQQQRQMGSECDHCINYGEHDVTQPWVLRELLPDTGTGTVRQYRPGPENSHIRIMRSSDRVFWTVGLSHREKRDRGEFSVYRRTGDNAFVRVSGRAHPKDPG